jgi:hypothetical protein
VTNIISCHFRLVNKKCSWYDVSISEACELVIQTSVYMFWSARLCLFNGCIYTWSSTTGYSKLAMKLTKTNTLKISVVLDKLIVIQLVEKFSAFMEHIKFITTFARARRESCTELGSSSIRPHTLFNFNIIVPSTLRSARWCLLIRVTCEYQPLCFDNPSDIWWSVHVRKLLVTLFQKSHRRTKNLPIK